VQDSASEKYSNVKLDGKAGIYANYNDYYRVVYYPTSFSQGSGEGSKV